MNNLVVIDTSVLSAFLKSEDKWVKYKEYLTDKRWVIPFSVFTEIELYFKIIDDKNERLDRYRTWQNVLATCEIKYPDMTICTEAADRAFKLRVIRANNLRQEVNSVLIGTPTNFRRYWPDIWAISTAAVLNLPIVTDDGNWEKWFPDLEIYSGELEQ